MLESVLQPPLTQQGVGQQVVAVVAVWAQCHRPRQRHGGGGVFAVAVLVFAQAPGGVEGGGIGLHGLLQRGRDVLFLLHRAVGVGQGQPGGGVVGGGARGLGQGQQGLAVFLLLQGQGAEQVVAVALGFRMAGEGEGDIAHLIVLAEGMVAARQGEAAVQIVRGQR